MEINDIKPFRVLYLDDNPLITLLARKIIGRITEHRFLVEHSRCNEDAIRRCKIDSPDFIVVYNGGASLSTGFEIIKKLLADEQIRKIPLLVISSLFDDTYINNVMGLGACAYLHGVFDNNLVTVLNILAEAKLNNQDLATSESLREFNKRMQEVAQQAWLNWHSRLKGQHIEVMIPEISKAMLKLHDRILQEVPEEGEFERIFEFFQDPSKKLDIVRWSLSVYGMTFEGADINKRYIELAGYLAGGYKITTIEASGTKTECLKYLISPESIPQILQSMRDKLEWSDD